MGARNLREGGLVLQEECKKDFRGPEGLLELPMKMLSGLVTGAVIVRYMDRIKGGPEHHGQVRVVRLDDVRRQIVVTVQPGDNKTHWRLSLTLPQAVNLNQVYADLVAKVGIVPVSEGGNGIPLEGEAELRVEFARLDKLQREQAAGHARQQAAEAERGEKRRSLTANIEALRVLLDEINAESQRAAGARAEAEEALETTKAEFSDVREKLAALEKRSQAIATARESLRSAGLDLTDPAVLAALRGEGE